MVPKSFFRCRHSKQSYRPDIPPCQGLKVYFGVFLGCKGGGGEILFLCPEKLFQVQAFQTELQARYSTMPGLEVYFSVFLGCKGGGGKKQLFRLRKGFFRGSAGKTSQDKPRQAKGSRRGQMTYSEPGWCPAETVDIRPRDHVKVWIFLGPAPYLSSAWKFCSA